MDPQLLLIDLIYLLYVPLDGIHFSKEPVGIVCHAFVVFGGGSILLALEMVSVLPIIFKLFRIAGFAHLLRMPLRFYPHF